jgi:uncharacterized membrane-anchored protein YjiN (DUF445 family)
MTKQVEALKHELFRRDALNKFARDIRKVLDRVADEDLITREDVVEVFLNAILFSNVDPGASVEERREAFVKLIPLIMDQISEHNELDVRLEIGTDLKPPVPEVMH